jgi:kynurenine formamidase
MYPYLDGNDPEVLEWITDSGLTALISDNYAVEGWATPSREPHTLIPVHNLCLFKLGIPLGEMWYTQELATWLRANSRSAFLLTAPPLRLPGTAGGPLNPIATV